MQSPPAEENTEEGNNEDGGWGISSVSAAFGGWGLTSSDPDQQQEDDEWKRQSRQMEDVAAHLPDQVAKAAEDAEHVLEDAVGEAAAAASSWFSGASSYFSGEEAAAAAEAVQEGGEKEGGDNDDNKQEPPSSSADALTSILQYNPLNSLAVGWINDLERESHADDPLRPIRDHLDAHLKDWPRSTYEEWVEESLVQLDKWDRGSAVVDETFYLEGSVHRKLWNDCMMADEIRCVLARKPRSATVATTTTGTTTTTTSSTASSARVSGATAVGSTASVSKENITTATDAKKKEETASPSLQTNIETTKKATPSSSAVSAAKDLLNEDDADLDELLGGGDEDDEICFVSPPNSGGL